MVQILSTETKTLLFAPVFLVSPRSREDLNQPPTSVGGIQDFQLPLFCRPDLNNPPTPVGGISEFFSSPVALIEF